MQIEAPLALSVDQFCDAHNVSRAYFYVLLKSNRGPRIMRVGRRTLVSAEAAADWRREREHEAATTQEAAA